MGSKVVMVGEGQNTPPTIINGTNTLTIIHEEYDRGGHLEFSSKMFPQFCQVLSQMTS